MQTKTIILYWRLSILLLHFVCIMFARLVLVSFYIQTSSHFSTRFLCLCHLFSAFFFSLSQLKRKMYTCCLCVYLFISHFKNIPIWWNFFFYGIHQSFEQVEMQCAVFNLGFYSKSYDKFEEEKKSTSSNSQKVVWAAKLAPFYTFSAT